MLVLNHSTLEAVVLGRVDLLQTLEVSFVTVLSFNPSINIYCSAIIQLRSRRIERELSERWR